MNLSFTSSALIEVIPGPIIRQFPYQTYSDSSLQALLSNVAQEKLIDVWLPYTAEINHPCMAGFSQ